MGQWRMEIILKSPLLFNIHPENSKYKTAVNIQNLCARTRFYDTAFS